ncbi:MAG: ABC transporter ATP-binding protein, partial [Acetobacteraceae bacterium]|nr:ABC transporter ATP-binding protein [Acetobacteraceae bacterium]
MSIAISLRSCGKTWAGGARGLLPIDMEITAGETLMLLGPSGCGKTTLLRLIAGLEMPDSGGQVFFDGKDVTRLPIERRNVGMVFQSYALFPNMDVTGNIGYGLRVRGTQKNEVQKRVAEMLEMMQLTEFRHRRIDALSGGQRQRVALARAIAPRPQVLLLDEPLSALDARLRDQLRQEIDTLLRALGITAIYVTHDQSEAMALGDRICVMEAGRIAQIGSGRDLYHHPANGFVADFIGDANRYVTQTGEVILRPEELSLRPNPNGA